MLLLVAFEAVIGGCIGVGVNYGVPNAGLLLVAGFCFGVAFVLFCLVVLTSRDGVVRW